MLAGHGFRYLYTYLALLYSLSSSIIWADTRFLPHRHNIFNVFYGRLQSVISISISRMNLKLTKIVSRASSIVISSAFAGKNSHLALPVNSCDFQLYALIRLTRLTRLLHIQTCFVHPFITAFSSQCPNLFVYTQLFTTS